MKEAQNKTQETIKRINNRFGEYNMDLGKKVSFPNGLIGLPDHKSFCLCMPPVEELQQGFTILQSVDNTELAMLVMPMEVSNHIYELEDMESACRMLDMSGDKIAVLLICSLKEKAEGERTLVVNARAPILVDVQNMRGAQYVMTPEKYSTQYEIGG
jgi:flagellar assembly factor FliW